MYQTQIILIKQSHPLYAYCDKNCKLAKNIKNATIFRLRQLQSAKKKNFMDLSDNEKEVLFYDIFKICIIHDVDFKSVNLNKTRILGIDLGVDNFLTTSNNCGLNPFIINGKVIKSYNQYFNKKMGEIQTKLAEKNLHTSKELSQLWRKRSNYIRNMEHQISYFVCNYCITNNIGTIVVGKNDNWKQNINIGKKNNQTFCFIPHAHFIGVLKNKALKYGIDVIEVEESYTSKASFLDMDVIPTYKDSKKVENNETNNNTEKNNNYKFSGSRIYRGLYKTNNGILINADVNGASNIIRKAFPDAFSNVVDFNYLIKTVNKYTLGKTTKKSENRDIQKSSRIKRKAG